MFPQSDDFGGRHMEPSSTDSIDIPSFPRSELTPSRSSGAEDVTVGVEPEAWRNEVAARLSRYRARRKAPPPRYPSLKLPFGKPESSPRAESVNMPHFEPVSSQALALDANACESMILEAATESRSKPLDRPQAELPPAPTAKIIEFPRFAWGPPPAPPDQLAEPVMDRPRILEVPEIPTPPPALGGITIESVEEQEVERRPGIDTPLHPAPLGLRVFALLVDGTIVSCASALFASIFWKLAAIQPPRPQLIAMLAGIPCIFWAAYQYLLIVYSGRTPGLRAAHLELTCFDGKIPRRSLRRLRVLASYLSALSLGMGYAWLFLDEDSLCWHDRITHTCFAPRKILR